MISFEPFRIYCVKNNKKQKDVRDETGLAHATVNKLFNDKPIKVEVVEKLCEHYDLKVEEVIEYKSTN